MPSALMKRICLALETESLDDIAERIRHLIKPKVPENSRQTGSASYSYGCGQVSAQTFQPAGALSGSYVITDPTEPMLDKLPIIKCWPEDAGPFVTLGVVITRDPKTGIRNLESIAYKSTATV